MLEEVSDSQENPECFVKIELVNGVWLMFWVGGFPE